MKYRGGAESVVYINQRSCFALYIAASEKNSEGKRFDKKG